MKAVWYRYDLPLRLPVRFGRKMRSRRTGFLVKLEDQTKNLSAGEAAPIDGYGLDTVVGVRDRLAEAGSRLEQLDIPESLEHLGQQAKTRLNDLPPTLRFACESALAGLAAARSAQTLCEWLGGISCVDVEVCGLGTVGEEADGRGVPQSVGSSDSYRVVKLKVGSDPIKDAAVVADWLNSEKRRAQTVRLDANRGWTIDEAHRFVDSLVDREADPDRIEFIEEPLMDVENLRSLSSRYPIRLALDETVLSAGFEHKRWLFAPVLVLKPSLYGGVIETVEFIRKARECGQRVVFSSAFESGAGMSVVANLAARYCNHSAGQPAPYATGFGAYAYLASDVMPTLDAFDPVRGKAAYSPADLPANPATLIDWDGLETAHE